MANLSWGSPKFSQEGKSLDKLTGGGKSEATKAALAQGGMSAGAGLLGGLAQVLTTTDPIEEQGRSGIPAGSVGSVGHSSTPTNLSTGRQQLPTSPSFAAAMLRGR